ncbi:MFS PHS inorganic phosphate transporter [Brachionus plicatilis]|uniref:MFS PHS inorganic phosphate transporter n=1 Tax=Brachionus plicatilis TaxID=10195 RepID=A0A3M7QN86_BRAPC|nr:MFS PHS inorganic phosphate transporter [Brachionus plicatilis]
MHSNTELNRLDGNNDSSSRSSSNRTSDHMNTITRHHQILSEIESKKFSWSHIKDLFINSVGFFTNGYQIFIINLIVLMMGCVYYKENTNTVPVYIDTFVKASAHIGILIGQLFFGFASDRFGRKRIFGIELIIMIIGGLGSTFSGSTATGMSVFVQLFLWRFILGFGIGGDYPLSATITSEGAKTKNRGFLLAAIFAIHGFGVAFAALISIIVLAAFKNAVYANQNALDYVWRVCLGLGLIPACIGVYFRLRISETPRYSIEVNHELKNGKKKASFKEFLAHFSKWKYFKILLATSVTWFCLDVGFYGVNLNSGLIIESIGFSEDIVKDPWKFLFQNSIGNLIISFLGILPGYWSVLAVFLVDRIGRKVIQLTGFGVVGVLFLVLGFGFNAIRSASSVLFIILFTVTQFFFTFGPNTTTFIIPGEVFPTRYRSTAHGISAAFGKLGAIVSQIGFFQMRDIGGKNNMIPLILILFSIFMFIGFIFTFLLPETKRISLEELSESFHSSDQTQQDTHI